MKAIDAKINAIIEAMADNEELLSARHLGLEQLRREKAERQRTKEENYFARIKRKKEARLARLEATRQKQAALKKKQLEIAAIRIQAGVLGIVVRQKLKSWLKRIRRDVSAKIIQGAAFGHAVRVWCRTAFKCVSYEHNEAASVLQGGLKGMKVRNLMFGIRLSQWLGAQIIQGLVRGANVRVRLRKYLSAEVLQALVLGGRARDDTRWKTRFGNRRSIKVIHATVCMYRDKLWMAQALKQEYHRADQNAKEIQAALLGMQTRMLLGRERCDLDQVGATRIQAIFRGRKERNAVQKQKQRYEAHARLCDNIANEAANAARHAENVIDNARMLLNEVFGEKSVATQILQDTPLYCDGHKARLYRRRVGENRHEEALPRADIEGWPHVHDDPDLKAYLHAYAPQD